MGIRFLFRFKFWSSRFLRTLDDLDVLYIYKVGMGYYKLPLSLCVAFKAAFLRTSIGGQQQASTIIHDPPLATMCNYKHLTINKRPCMHEQRHSRMNKDRTDLRGMLRATRPCNRTYVCSEGITASWAKVVASSVASRYLGFLDSADVSRSSRSGK